MRLTNSVDKLKYKLVKEWIDKGNQFYRNGNDESAIEAYEMVLKINPNDEVAWNNIGNVYCFGGVA